MVAYKVPIFVLMLSGYCMSTTIVKRAVVGQQNGLEFLHLGNFGPISRLPSHPSFTQLGLTPQQTVGFVNLLLQNGLLNYNAIKHQNGQPIFNEPAFFPPNLLPPLVPIDPYFLFLYNSPRFLPFGLGPQGIYGSTGLPRPKPLGDFKFSDKSS